jgi:hexulose-6-phosphate isomerase
MLKRVVAAAAEVGARRVLLPLLEQAQVDSQNLQDDVVRSIELCLPTVERYQVALGLEMEVPGERYRALIDRIGHPLVGAYYDTGNSTAQGLDIGVDVERVQDRLLAVHVKDRKVHGKSCPLGTGDANFEGFFRVALGAGFLSDVICQHYYGSDYDSDARRSLEFVTQALSRAAREAA